MKKFSSSFRPLCAARALEATNFIIFLIEPLSSDVKANYIYHSHFEKLGDVIIYPVLWLVA